MSAQFARLLLNQPQVNQFLSISLGVNLDDYPDIEYAIIESEKGIIDGLQSPTLTSKDYRDRKYTDHSVRIQLRKQIVDELFSQFLLENDDDLRLGIGGAIPRQIQKNKQAYFLIGLPASGKSSVATAIANTFGAIILDSDFAKRKLPEFAKYDWGASVVHAESSQIVFGSNTPIGYTSLYEMAVSANFNVVIPKIGDEPEDIIERCRDLKQLGYTVHLTLVYLPKEKSTRRALKRFHKSKRYVPLARIFDVYGNNPALTYFLFKNRQVDYIDTYGVIKSDVPEGAVFVCTDLQGDNPANLYQEEKNSLI